MRLVHPDGPDKTEGRAEYCSNGLWGTVSAQTGFGANDGKVVCRRLGFQSPSKNQRQNLVSQIIKSSNLLVIGVQLFNSSYYGEGTGPIVYNGLNCDGSESRLEECPTTVVPYNTTHFYDVGIKCYEKGINTRCL